PVRAAPAGGSRAIATWGPATWSRLSPAAPPWRARCTRPRPSQAWPPTAPGVAESVRIARRSPRRMMRAVEQLAVALVVVFVAWGVVVYLLPDPVGEALLKRSWQPTHEVIPAYTAVVAAQGMLTAATVGLRAMAAAK